MAFRSFCARAVVIFVLVYFTGLAFILTQQHIDVCTYQDRLVGPHCWFVFTTGSTPVAPPNGPAASRIMAGRP